MRPLRLSRLLPKITSQQYGGGLNKLKVKKHISIQLTKYVTSLVQIKMRNTKSKKKQKTKHTFLSSKNVTSQQHHYFIKIPRGLK